MKKRKIINFRISNDAKQPVRDASEENLEIVISAPLDGSKHFAPMLLSTQKPTHTVIFGKFQSNLTFSWA